jgi:hypothetical protein
VPSSGSLAATAEFAAARSVLRELIRLVDQAPGLTEEQLRFPAARSMDRPFKILQLT